MITSCPHCGQKVRVADPGKYRCPACKEVFEHKEDPLQESAGEEESGPGDIYVEVPGYQTDMPPVQEDLYVDPEEAATACETCGRPGSTKICKSCGRFVCNTCVNQEYGEDLCPNCLKKRERDEVLASVMPGGVFASSRETFLGKIKGVLLTPTAFFASPREKEAFFSGAFWVSLACYVIGGIFASAYTIIQMRQFGDQLDPFLAELGVSMGSFDAMLRNPGQTFLEMALFLPLYWLIMLFVTSAVVHLFLLMFGSPAAAFRGTFLVVGYSFAASLLKALPLVGGMVALVWQVIIIIIGAAVVHRMTTNRTAAAVLLPFGIMFFVVILIAMILVPVLLKALGV